MQDGVEIGGIRDRRKDSSAGGVRCGSETSDFSSHFPYASKGESRRRSQFVHN